MGEEIRGGAGAHEGRAYKEEGGGELAVGEGFLDLGEGFGHGAGREGGRVGVVDDFD